jgi:hypothetical protein
MNRLEIMSRTVRNRLFYSIPDAGSQVGLKRSQAYIAADAGEIPTVRRGRFRLVPRIPWDRKVKRLLRDS